MSDVLLGKIALLKIENARLTVELAAERARLGRLSSKVRSLHYSDDNLIIAICGNDGNFDYIMDEGDLADTSQEGRQ